MINDLPFFYRGRKKKVVDSGISRELSKNTKRTTEKFVLPSSVSDYIKKRREKMNK